MKKLTLFLLFLFLTACNSSVDFQASSEQETIDNLIISQGAVIDMLNISQISTKTLEVSESLNLYTLLSKNEAYEPIAVQWTLVGLIGSLNVINGGHQADFTASTPGTGYIEISYGNISKKISLTVNVPVGSAPVTTSTSLARMTQDQEEVFNLNYTDADSDDATSCIVSNLTNLTISTACTCVSGNCTVGLTGTAGYEGSASFDFLVSSNGQESNVSSVTINILPKCPTGFIAVDGNTTIGTSNFCVMKYEAKNVGGVATSQAALQPWTNSTASVVFSKCGELAESGFTGTFSLISNQEWMTIARDIENNAANWSGSSVGLGHIPRGHSDNSPATTLAVTDTNDVYNGTGNSISDLPGSGWEQKRVHTLSNNNEIWDFAGNAFELVDWDKDTAGFNLGPQDEGSTWKELSSPITGVTLLPDDYLPSGSHTKADNSIGAIYGGSGGRTIRGGDYQHTEHSGIYTAHFYANVNQTAAYLGFRCVYRP